MIRFLNILIKTSEVIVINRVIITTQFEENEFKKIDLEANACNAMHV